MGQTWENQLSSPVFNYAVRGLTSRLLEGWRPRVFTTGSNSTLYTLPHSHRYDLLSIVLAGSVTNRIWHRGLGDSATWHSSTLHYQGAPGQYVAEPHGPAQWRFQPTAYWVGEHYFMQSSDIHSIAFSANATVLIVEGPSVANWSTVLHPGPEFTVEDGLFTKDEP
jgi:hypothetical protein